MRRSLITMAAVVGLAATTLAGASTAQAGTNDPFYGKLWGLQQVVGVAPDARILPVKVLEAGSGSSDEIAAGIRWATDNGADVINLRLGSIPGGQVVSISGLDTSTRDAIA